MLKQQHASFTTEQGEGRFVHVHTDGDECESLSSDPPPAARRRRQALGQPARFFESDFLEFFSRTPWSPPATPRPIPAARDCLGSGRSRIRGDVTAGT